MRDWKISLWAGRAILALLFAYGRAILALFFAYAGILKISRTPEALAAMGWHWTVDVPPALVTFIGTLELLGAIGLILPAALQILPWLTPLAAAGMILLQLAAVALHLSRGETGVLWLNVILVFVAGEVAWVGFNCDARC